MAIRSDREPPFHRPAAGPARSLGPWDDARVSPPGGEGHGAGHGTDPAAGSVALPEAGGGFLSGQRGPRAVSLILTTGTIGSALAGLLLASGVLTPASGGRPAGLAQAPPTTTSAPEGGASVAPVPSPTARVPSTPPPKPRTAPPSGAPASGASPRTPAPAPPVSVPSPASRPSRAADPDVLRQGDTGPAVRELQERLSEIPHVYPDGGVDGRYDAAVAEAVARYQEWYGVRGDEEGVYGDDTRRDLEERT
ncbi:hypothetical protein F0L17_01875 [Streptomyces sp. TRM43335]|uniref:Peptidoglycan binding-like domain-containing protein n=1 Tax=Streptomyces taklimakanensis TaxID=2569853 RepID=A0A6G2B6M2_9ACTN|nr:peptidoglycan-binding domain-containing protein [Streptomyces taklimakanensis]MTE17900.1 hypothetical protein [Streptomyces taklimakanensis]